jgi:hypothetical protein
LPGSTASPGQDDLATAAAGEGGSAGVRDLALPAPLEVPQFGPVAQGRQAAVREPPPGAVAEVEIAPLGPPAQVPDARIGEPAGAAENEARFLPEPDVALQACVCPRPRGVSGRRRLRRLTCVRRSIRPKQISVIAVRAAGEVGCHPVRRANMRQSVPQRGHVPHPAAWVRPGQ